MTARGETDLGIHGLVDAVEVGAGGFATVYRARQIAFDRPVAVKVFRDLTVDSATLAIFQRECQAVGRVGGRRNILAVYDQGMTTTGQPYLIMPFMVGGSLQDLLNRVGRLPWQEAVDLGAKLAEALQIAHQANVLHRDVKPANVLLDADGEPQLADFGIARLTDATRLTVGQASFTPAHVAPEVLTGAPATSMIDVYSLASTVFELIAGRPAFVVGEDDTFYSVMNRVESSPVPDLRPFDVPDALCSVIESAMAKDPAQRPPSAGALAAALGAARRAPPPTAVQEQPQWPPPATAVQEQPQWPPPTAPSVAPPPSPPPTVASPPFPPPTAEPTRSQSTVRSETEPIPLAPPAATSGRDRRRAPLLAGVVGGLVALAVIVAVALAVLNHHNPGSPTSTTTNPPTSSASTAQDAARQQAQGLNALLTQSASDRNAIVAATNDIGNCGNLAQDQSTLQSAAQSRQTLLSQLTQLPVSGLPNSSAVISSLTSAWQASMQADNDYAAWANDLQSSGCGAPSSNDSNWQAAQTADRQATAAKTQFVNAWNPIAAMYGLPQYTQAKI